MNLQERLVGIARAAWKQSGHTQEDIAAIVGDHPISVSRRLCGRKRFYLDTLQAHLSACGCDANWLGLAILSGSIDAEAKSDEGR